VQSRAPEYSGSSDLPAASNPQTLSAAFGEPAPTAPRSAAPPTSAAPVVVVPRLPGTPDLTKDGLYVFVGGGIELAVDPRSGTAVRLSLDGKGALIPLETDADNHFSAELEGSALVLKNPDGALVKRFRLDTARRSVEVTYVVTNVGPRPVRSGALDSHRVASAGGLTFFPGTPVSLPGRTLRLNAWQSLVWFRHDQNREVLALEAHAESSEGWVATVNDGLLLVKAFGDTAKPTIVIKSAYDAATKNHPWLQIDEQSAALELAPGASTTTSVRLFLRKLPSSIAAKAGNQELVGFVRGVIQ
jgi:hypothetical protein